MVKKHNANLDILRGVAALLVVAFHFVNIYGYAFDKHFQLGPIFNYNFPGHLSVLVFFILSGYVINATTSPLANKESIRLYISKRLIRILPIYFLAIIFTVLVTKGQYEWGKILANFFFISVPLDNVYVENGSIWSLNYELIYYAMFLPLSYYKVSMTKTVQILLILIVVMFLLFHNIKIPPLIISYVIGFLFWITGAMLAGRAGSIVWNISTSRIISLFTLLFCLMQFNPYDNITGLLHIPLTDYSALSFFQQSITWSDMFYFPICILLILGLTRSQALYAPFLIYLTFVLALFKFVIIWQTMGFQFILTQHYLLPGLVLIGSILLWLGNFEASQQLKNKLKLSSALGGISYGVYIIHVPLMFYFGRFTVTSGVMYATKVTCFFILLFLISWVLEAQFQPFIRKVLLFSKKSDINV
jgi:peptidoglycan/LPS O-acetylase OafA/YrhL